MELSFIGEKIKNGDYDKEYPRYKYNKIDPNTVTDENKSVKWNRNKALQLEEKRKEEIRNYRSRNMILAQTFEKDVIQGIEDSYHLNKNVGKKIFDKAYEMGHSEGKEEVLNYIYKISDFIQDIINVF